MKFLIQGIGSVGQRHYKNLKSLGYQVAILRSSDKLRPFVRNFFNEQKEKKDNPLVFYKLSDAIEKWKPDAIIISNPNNMHCDSAYEAIKKGLNLFIEKPVIHNTKNKHKLINLLNKTNLVAMVGYNLRFHPLIIKIKRMVERGDLGKLYSANVEVGENITDWHPWENYLDTYAPYVKGGGGSLLCFSHDIDYLFWIFGEPRNIYACGGKVTSLGGDAEDLVQSLWEYKDGKTATIHIDYWQRPKVRTLKIIGSKKTILWDYYGDLKIWNHENGKLKAVKVPKKFERNRMFIDEIKHFVKCVKEKGKPSISVQDGCKVVGIVEKIKKQINKK
jgi:predicted dehydrogenase